MTEPITLRPLDDTDSIPPITRLLRDAYAALADMGFRYLATHQDDETTAKRLRQGQPVIAELDGRIVGTVTLYPPRDESPCVWYMRPEVWSFGQFAVEPGLQRSGVGTRLLEWIERRAAEQGAEELALDTAEGATHLRAWYTRLGYRDVGYATWEVTNYRSVIMSKRLVTGE